MMKKQKDAPHQAYLPPGRPNEDDPAAEVGVHQKTGGGTVSSPQKDELLEKGSKTNTAAKVNILVAGSCQDSMSAIVEENTLVCDLPPVGSFRILPSEDEFFEIESASAGGLIRRIVETPVASFIEASALVPVFEQGDGRPCCGEMSDYLKEVEAELRSSGVLPDGAAKIDVVWYCLGDRIDFTDEDEQDFIWSVAGVPRVIIVADPGFSSRSMFKETMDFLAGLAGHRLILNCVVVQPDALVLSGARRLLETTKNLCLCNPDWSKAEKSAFEAAWTEYYADLLEELQEVHGDDVSHVLQCAAERAQAILKRNETAELGNMIGECVSIVANLFKVVKGEADTEVMRNKSHADVDKWDHQRTNELKFNIVCEVYEVAACFGRIVPRHVVRKLLRLIPDDFPKNAVAVTYAVGYVAAVLAEDYFWYAEAETVKTTFDEAKAEAMQMEFEPFDDSMIMRGEDEDIEPDFDDSESSGEADAESAPDRKSGDETPETFFEQVTKSIKASWAEQDAAAGKTGGTHLLDAAANTPGDFVPPQNIGNAGPVLVGPAETVDPEPRPGKTGKTAGSKADSSAKTEDVKSRTGRSRSAQGRKNGKD